MMNLIYPSEIKPIISAISQPKTAPNQADAILTGKNLTVPTPIQDYCSVMYVLSEMNKPIFWEDDSNWILKNGIWEDSGVWEDDNFWIDTKITAGNISPNGNLDYAPNLGIYANGDGYYFSGLLSNEMLNGNKFHGTIALRIIVEQQIVNSNELIRLPFKDSLGDPQNVTISLQDNGSNGAYIVLSQNGSNVVTSAEVRYNQLTDIFINMELKGVAPQEDQYIWRITSSSVNHPDFTESSDLLFQAVDLVDENGDVQLLKATESIRLDYAFVSCDPDPYNDGDIATRRTRYQNNEFFLLESPFLHYDAEIFEERVIDAYHDQITYYQPEVSLTGLYDVSIENKYEVSDPISHNMTSVDMELVSFNKDFATDKTIDHDRWIASRRRWYPADGSTGNGTNPVNVKVEQDGIVTTGTGDDNI